MLAQEKKSISALESILSVSIQQPDFLHRLKEYKEKLRSFDLGFPDAGMLPKEFLDWVKKYNQKAYELSEDANFTDYKQSVLKDSKTMSHSQFIQIETYRAEHFLPLDWFQILADAMISIGLDPANKNEKSFVVNFFFYGKKRVFRNVWSKRIQKNKDTGEVELFIEIFPHTTQKIVLEQSYSWKSDRIEMTKDKPYPPRYKRQLVFMELGTQLFVKVERHVTTNFLIKNWFQIEKKKKDFFGEKKRERRSSKLELLAEKLVGTIERDKTQKEIILEKLRSKKSQNANPRKKTVQNSQKLAQSISTTSDAVRRSRHKIRKTQVSLKKKFMR